MCAHNRSSSSERSSFASSTHSAPGSGASLARKEARMASTSTIDALTGGGDALSLRPGGDSGSADAIRPPSFVQVGPPLSSLL